MRSELGGTVEGRLHAEEQPADEGRRAGRDRHRQEGSRAHLRQHQLDGEHHAADRRVECRGDAGAGARGDERDALPRRHAHDLPERRAERRADLNDRAFAADRRPLPIDRAEASDLTTATTGRISPSL